MTKQTVIFLAVTLTACGGQVDGDGVDSGGTVAETGTEETSTIDSGSDSIPTDFGVDVGPDLGPCMFSNGVPKCEATGCTDPPVATCELCVKFFSDAKLTSFGACSKLEAEKMWGRYGGSTCSFCLRPDLVCARTKYDLADDLSCVSPVVCEEANKEGLPATCRWTDKSTWRPGATIPAIACPAAGAALGMCGGSCGECTGGNFCTGRSPVHPFGVCVAPNRIGPSGSTPNRCRRSMGCTAAGDACLIWAVEPFEQPLADTHGVCVATDRCKSLKASLPGGVRCIAPGGAEL